MALGFAVDSTQREQPALYVSFEESARQIERNAGGFAWDLEGLSEHGLLDIYHVSPSELNVDRHAYLKGRADRPGARMVVIDSLTAFQAAVPDPGKYQSYVWAINDYFKRDGVSVIMTAEVPDISGPLEISAQSVSFLADNIIFLPAPTRRGPTAEPGRPHGCHCARGSRRGDGDASPGGGDTIGSRASHCASTTRESAHG